MGNLRSLLTSCTDYNEGDRCDPEEFVQFNCTIARIQCIYVSYGFVDETFENYFNEIWSHRVAQFLSQHSWLVHIFNIFIIYWLLAFTIALEEMILACTFACKFRNEIKKIVSNCFVVELIIGNCKN